MYQRKQVLSSIETLYNDIDSTISSLITARMNHNKEDEAKALGMMESLLVGCQQELSLLSDYIEGITIIEEIE